MYYACYLGIICQRGQQPSSIKKNGKLEFGPKTPNIELNHGLVVLT
jgi:hypothetical protein